MVLKNLLRYRGDMHASGVSDYSCDLRWFLSALLCFNITIVQWEGAANQRCSKAHFTSTKTQFLTLYPTQKYLSSLNISCSVAFFGSSSPVLPSVDNPFGWWFNLP